MRKLVKKALCLLPPVKRLRDNLRNLRQETERLRSQTACLQEEKNAVETNCQRLQEEKNAIETNCRRLQEEKNAVEMNCQRLQEEKSAAEANCRRLQEEQAELQNKIALVSSAGLEAKPRLYMHIGLTKTGSTALQTFFTKNIPLLNEQGVLYPIVDGNPINARVWIGNAYTFSQSLYDGEYSPEGITSIAENLYFEALKAKKNILFSCEIFSEISESNIVELLLSSFKKYFSIELIFFVRDPLNWYFSRWKQEFKIRPETRDFATFIEEHPNQCALLPLWLSLADAVHAFSYEEHKEDLLTPFFSSMEISLPAYPEGAGSQLTLDNRTLTDSELSFFKLFNQIPALAADKDLRSRINAGFLFERKETSPLRYSKPDPGLAPLALERHEDFLKALAPYLPREKILCSHPPNAETASTASQLEPEVVRVAFSVLGRYFSKEVHV
jgi:hypothetical protein